MNGSLATAVAIMAVVVLGFIMLTGQLRWRRGVEVVLGVFVIFGASSLVDGALTSYSSDLAESKEFKAVIPISKVSVQPPAPTVYDPYAGASVPSTHPPSDLIAPRP